MYIVHVHLKVYVLLIQGKILPSQILPLAGTSTAAMPTFSAAEKQSKFGKQSYINTIDA